MNNLSSKAIRIPLLECPKDFYWSITKSLILFERYTLGDTKLFIF